MWTILMVLGYLTIAAGAFWFFIRDFKTVYVKDVLILGISCLTFPIWLLVLCVELFGIGMLKIGTVLSKIGNYRLK